MYHAGARQGMFFQQHRQLIVGTSGVEDHRQIVTLRQPQLLLQQRLLAVKLRIVAIEIEANLPHRHQFWRTQGHQGFQLRQPLIGMLLNDDRMHAQRGVQRLMLRRQRQHPVKTRSGDGRDNDLPDTDLGRARQAGGFILGEGRKIEVAVGIDKTVAHARSS